MEEKEALTFESIYDFFLSTFFNSFPAFPSKFMCVNREMKRNVTSEYNFITAQVKEGGKVTRNGTNADERKCG